MHNFQGILCKERNESGVFSGRKWDRTSRYLARYSCNTGNYLTIKRASSRSAARYRRATPSSPLVIYRVDHFAAIIGEPCQSRVDTSKTILHIISARIQQRVRPIVPGDTIGPFPSQSSISAKQLVLSRLHNSRLICKPRCTRRDYRLIPFTDDRSLSSTLSRFFFLFFLFFSHFSPPRQPEVVSTTEQKIFSSPFVPKRWNILDGTAFVLRQ